MDTPIYLEMQQSFPWAINIEPKIASIPRLAHASQQKTYADMKDAVGFPPKERDEIRAMLQKQEDFWIKAVSAINSHDDFKETLTQIALQRGKANWGGDGWAYAAALANAAQKALVKAGAA